ncbi:MAG: transcription antitermination factor NusB [Clostridiales Family XIII bacterium]|jgi:N utilization substance protein B|nr:transcription antitermination factor NusB [Clostridiales Family XIII bacterium]
MSSRRAVRELLMCLIYQMSVTDNWSDEDKEGFLADAANGDVNEAGYIDDAGRQYFEIVIGAVRDNLEEIDGVISDASDNWRIGRISKVDLSIIRLAVSEMMYIPDIPPAVSINEAVDLAKRYGSDKSYEFVNGVLGRVARNIPTNSMTESGSD